jgi:4-hydroxybenzoate polyprenyltransferase
MSIIIEYFKLARLHSSVLSGLTPVLGAISVGVLDIVPLSILFLIGICTHIFGFVFNEYMDIEIDRTAEHLSSKPLISGTIPKDAALGFAFSSIIIGYFLLGYLLLLYDSNAIFAVIIYTLSWLSIGVYDLFSKSVRGSDLALASWTGGLCLMGGFAVVQTPNLLLFVIAWLAFLQLLIQNILAGLKDTSQDSSGSGTTTSIRMGVRLIGSRLEIPARFQSTIYWLKISHFIFVFVPFFFGWLILGFGQLFFILLFLVLIFYLVYSIFNAIIFKREVLLRKIGLHEIISYSIVPVMFFGIIGLVEIIMLIIFPIIWLAFFMRIMYGRLLPTI